MPKKMNTPHPLPTWTQIDDVRRLLWTGLYDITTVARLTGISQRDVFRIEKSMFVNKQ